MAKKMKVNETLINILAPTTIKFNRNDFEYGENYARIYGIIKYPQQVRSGFFNNISNIPHTFVNYHFKPVDNQVLLEAMGRANKQQSETLMNSNDTIVQKNAEIALENIDNLLNRMQRNNEVMGEVSTTIMAFDKDKEDFEKDCRKVVGTIAGESCQSRALPNLQKECFINLSPTHSPQNKINQIFGKVMPLSTFIGGFPFSTVGFNDGTGFYFAKDTSGSLIICDFWKRENDRINSNIVITGKPGSGKSTTIKHILLNEYAKGTKIIIIDPEREYKAMCEAVGGDWVNLVGGKNKINPFNFNIAPKDIDENGEDIDDGLPELARHIGQLETFLQLYARNLENEPIMYLKKVLYELYQKFNITFETKAENLKPEDYPTFSDLDLLLNEKLKTSDNAEEKTIINKIINAIFDITYGGDKFLWNGHTNINTNSDFIVFDTKDLQESSDSKKRAEYFNVITYIWNMIEKDRKEKVLFVCDESYLLIDTQVPQTLIFLRNVSKRIRKYEGGLCLITHDIEDFLNPSIKMYGQSLLSTACYKILFGTDGKNLEEETELFNLTEAENELLYSQRRGHALFIAGTKKIHANFIINDTEFKYMGNAGGR